MLKIIVEDPRHVYPFNERARDLRIQNKPLWLHQRDVLAPYTHQEYVIPYGSPLPQVREACIVYRDHLFFDSFYLQAFLEQAQEREHASRAGFTLQDAAFREHALPLATSYTVQGDLYLADLWYFPHGIEADIEPLVIDLQAKEVGYYHVPTYMATESGDLVFQVPRRAFVAIDSWVHIFIADVVFGVFSRGVRFEDRLASDPWFKLGILAQAMYEGKQVLECSKLVRLGGIV